MLIEFISVTIFATLLKLSSSVDDAVWLSKLVNKETKAHKQVIELTYIASLIIVTALSYFIYLIGSEALSYISDIDEILPLVSASILILFSLTYLRHDHNTSDQTNSSKKSLGGKIMTAFMVSFIGSIDELLLFITVLSTGKVSVIPLFVGTTIAAVIIILIVSGITKANFLMNILNKIPVWVVIFMVGLIALLLSLHSIWNNI